MMKVIIITNRRRPAITPTIEPIIRESSLDSGSETGVTVSDGTVRAVIR